MVRAIRGHSVRTARQVRRRVASGLTAVRLAPVRLGSPIGVVFGFHGVVERVDDRDLQLNHVDLAAFGLALDAIRSRFEIVALADLAAALDDGRPPSFPLAALSFDDGYRSNLELVHPLLASRQVPYAVFVCPGLIDAGARLPTFVAHAAISFVGADEIALPGMGSLRLGTEAERRATAWQVVELVKRLPHREVHALVAACRVLLGGDEWGEIERRFESEALLSWDEVRRLAHEGVTIGSHTLDHVGLHARQTTDDVQSQLVGSRRRLEEELECTWIPFSYPYGRYVDLSPDGVAAVASAGYPLGLTLETGTVRAGMSPLLLPRVYVGPKFDPTRLDRLLAPVRDRTFVDTTARLRIR